jgi:hypothetical protein
LQHNFGGLDQPDPQDLVDVVTGQATAQQRLLVDAYIRKSARGRRELALLKKEFALLEKRPAVLPRLPVFMATLALGAAGLKSQTISQGLRPRVDEETERTYQVTELQVQVTLRIPSKHGEHWQLSGLVTQQQQPVANAQVTLRASRARPRPRHTDEMGFFEFRRLPDGIYRLRIYLEQGTVRTPDIELFDHR